MAGHCKSGLEKESSTLPTKPERISRVGRPPKQRRYSCVKDGRSLLQIPDKLKQLLPNGYNHHLCNFRDVTDGFVATIRADFESAEAARRWLRDFQESSLTTFRMRRTFPRPGTHLLYKAWFRCHRNVAGHPAPSAGHSRHTACPASLAVTIARRVDGEPRSRADPHLPRYPGCVDIKHVHNHVLQGSDSLRFRDVSAATLASLRGLFDRGYRPAAALRSLKHQLALQLGEKFSVASADRAVLPTLVDVCRIHRRFIDEKKDEGSCVDVVVQTESEDDDDPNCSGNGSSDGANIEGYNKQREEFSGTKMTENGEPSQFEGEELLVAENETIEEVVECDSDATPAGEVSSETISQLHTYAAAIDHASEESDSPMFLPTRTNYQSAPAISSSIQDACNLERHIQIYNGAMNGKGVAVFLHVENGGFAAALTTPLMQRVHRLIPQAGEVMYVESGTGHGHVLWLLVCAAESGALPLGVLMASKTVLLNQALECWHRTLPAEAFGGRGAAGPQVVIVDDQPAQRAALACRYPAAVRLLCAFRLLQAVWRWLQRRRLAVDDRSALLQLARRLLCARSLSELERVHSEVITDPLLVRHVELRRHLSAIYEHRHLWAAWYAEDNSSLPNSVSDQLRVEASFFTIASQVLGDRLLFMASELRAAEAFDFLTRHADAQYVSRVENRIIGDRAQDYQPRYVAPPSEGIIQIRRLSTLEHQVTVKGERFVVLPWLACCSCKQGRIGAPCLHQSAVVGAEPSRSIAELPAPVADRLRVLIEELQLYDPIPTPFTSAWLNATGMSQPAKDLSSSTRRGSSIHADELPSSALCGQPSTSGEPNSTDAVEDELSCAAAGAVSDDPEEVAMSEVICQLQGVTSDLTGRLAADPAAYIPLVRSFVTQYWQMVNQGTLQGLSGALADSFPAHCAGIPAESGEDNPTWSLQESAEH